MSLKQQSLDIFGVTEKKGVPVTSSRNVAKVFDKDHKHVLRDIEIVKFDLLNIEPINESNLGLIKMERYFIDSTYKDSRGRKQPEVLLPRDGLTLLTMGYTGAKAMGFKIAYIDRYNEMEQFIDTLNAARLEYPEFTAAILSAHEEIRPYHFSNEINMINTIVLGMTAKKFKEVNELGDVQSIRPYLTNEQISAIEKLQKHDIGLVLTEPDFQRRKEILTNLYNRLGSIRLVAG